MLNWVSLRTSADQSDAEPGWIGSNGPVSATGTSGGGMSISPASNTEGAASGTAHDRLPGCGGQPSSTAVAPSPKSALGPLHGFATPHAKSIPLRLCQSYSRCHMGGQWNSSRTFSLSQRLRSRQNISTCPLMAVTAYIVSVSIVTSFIISFEAAGQTTRHIA